MKKNILLLAAGLSTAALWSCSDNNSSKSNEDSTTISSSTDTSRNGTQTMNTNDSANNMSGSAGAGTANKGPLAKEDSMFVMKAAMGGMMEVQAGQLAQQNAMNDRVKAFGGMMVTDHTKANQELMSLASSHGLTIPQDLPADTKKHIDAMQNMKGKAFDSHYMGMMVTDHKKTLDDFEKQANSGKDEELKAWAAKTLPVLKMHRDSATAISKAKM